MVRKLYSFLFLFIIFTINVNAENTENNVFDAVEILEHLANGKNLSENLDLNCDCNISLQDAFIAIENSILNQKSNCNLSKCRNLILGGGNSDTANTTIENKIKNDSNMTNNVISANENIKNYSYKGNFTGNGTGNMNGTANGNATIFIVTTNFNNVPFDANFSAILNGTYNGNYTRDNNTGYIEGNASAKIDANISVNTSFGTINTAKNITNTTEFKNETHVDIYNVSIQILEDNETKINFSGEENVDNISCYKIVAIPNKNKIIKVTKNFVKTNENFSLNLNELDIKEENIKEAKITYWIIKDNFSILKEQLDISIENFTQKINKTFKVNKCESSICVKNVTVETIHIQEMNLKSTIIFTNISKKA